MSGYNLSMETQLLIDALKKGMKLKGVTFEKMAEFLGISERSISRVFSEGTLSVNRLLKACEYLDFSLKDLLELVDLEFEYREFNFTREQEEFFAENPEYALFYNLINHYDSIKNLAQDYGIDENTVVKILAKLEKLKLIEWLPGNEAKTLGPRKFASQDGPLHKSQSSWIIPRLVENSLNAEKDRDIFLLINLSKPMQNKLKDKLEEVSKEIRKDMDMDRVLKTPTELVGVYLLVRSADFVYERLKNLKL